MANSPTPILKAIGSGFKGLFGFIFKIKWRYWILIAVFIQAIFIGYQSGSMLETIKILGEKFVGVTNNIVLESQGIIDNGAKFTSIFSFISVSWNLFSSFYILYLWFLIFFKGFQKSPISNNSNDFINGTLSIIVLYLFQIFYLLATKYAFGYSSMNTYSFWEIFAIPINSFKMFFKALFLIFTSTSFNKVVDNQINNTISNICSDNASVCVI